jgi:hypothetical protein
VNFGREPEIISLPIPTFTADNPIKQSVSELMVFWMVYFQNT